MSDSQEKSKDHLPQDAFSNVPFTPEDAYFAEQEKITLELLKKERAKKADQSRLCLNSACEDKKMETVEIDNVEIDKCISCGAVWLDPGELELLMKRAKGSKNGLIRFFHGLAGHYDD